MNIEKLKQLLLKLNETGIPLPLLRDNATDKGSYTLTMMWVSFNIAILTLAGKVTNLIGDVDYSNVLWLLATTSGLYLGRKFQSGKDGITVETKEEGKE